MMMIYWIDFSRRPHLMTIKTILVLCMMGMLTGCFSVSSLKDPFGAYEAKVTVAQYDRDARIAEAENAAWASVGSAQAWSNTVPTVALIVGVSVAVVVYIHWHGRITLARVQSGELPQPWTRPQVGDAHLEELKTIAAQRNQQFKVVNGIALLIDKKTGAIVKQRPL
jgi:hypothetical protein